MTAASVQCTCVCLQFASALLFVALDKLLFFLFLCAGICSSVTAVVAPAEGLQAEPRALAGGGHAQAGGNAARCGKTCGRGEGGEREQRQKGELDLLTHTLSHNLAQKLFKFA